MAMTHLRKMGQGFARVAAQQESTTYLREYGKPQRNFNALFSVMRKRTGSQLPHSTRYEGVFSICNIIVFIV